MCVDEWHYLDEARARCTACDTEGAAALVFPLGLGLALTAVTGLLWRPAWRWWRDGRLAAVSERLARLGLMGKAKVVLGYLQVVLVAPEAFSLQLPPEYFKWMAPLDWAMLDWITVAKVPAPCVGSFFERLGYTAFGSLALVFVLTGGGGTVWWGPIPMLSIYDAGTELPVLPWNESIG